MLAFRPSFVIGTFRGFKVSLSSDEMTADLGKCYEVVGAFRHYLMEYRILDNENN